MMAGGGGKKRRRKKRHENLETYQEMLNRATEKFQ